MKPAIFLSGLLILSSTTPFEAMALQRELLGVALGSPIEEAHSALETRFGKPLIAGQHFILKGEGLDRKYQVYLVNPERQQTIAVIRGERVV